jgi:hypothetical protein
VGVAVGVATGDVLGSGLGLVLVESLDGDGVGLAGGVDVSAGEGLGDVEGTGVSDGDAEADGLTSAGLLLTNAAVSTAVLGGDEQVVLVARAGIVASAA